jgi:hypothetical protein
VLRGRGRRGNGLVELSLFTQASSLKTEVAAEFDLGGICTCEAVVVKTVGTATSGKRHVS